MNYYNEFHQKTAAWLRQLIADGLLPKGDVDERSIEDVTPRDLRGYTQCHFFAGIGGWSYALDLAGWPRDLPVWTGSCPCQPFSTAGKGNGFDDQRHLWPAWFHLINQCRPPSIFGEQVASADALRWLDLVSDDLESAGYAIAAADLCASGVGAPHIRQRVYWMGYANSNGRNPRRLDATATGRNARNPIKPTSGCDDWMAYTSGSGLSGHGGLEQIKVSENRREGTNGHGSASCLGHWNDANPVIGADGKSRPLEPGASPLAHGIPARVVRLSGYGNAIVPQVAAEFVKASIEAMKECP